MCAALYVCMNATNYVRVSDERRVPPHSYNLSRTPHILILIHVSSSRTHATLSSACYRSDTQGLQDLIVASKILSFQVLEKFSALLDKSNETAPVCVCVCACERERKRE